MKQDRPILTPAFLAEIRGDPSFWRALVEGTPSGFLLVDRDHTVVEMNAALLSWIRKPREDVIGKKCHQVLFRSDRPCDLPDGGCPAAQAFSTGEPSPKMPCTGRPETGSPRPWRLQAYPLRAAAAAPELVLEFVEDVTAAMRVQQLEQESALRDPLTGLFNRKAFHLFYERAFKRTRRQGQPFSLALVDLDSFKDFNERQGDEAGDALLADMGRFLIGCTRKEVDTVFRLEADRFSILLPETDRRHTAMISDRIRAAEKGAPFPITFSLAICQARQDGDTSTLLHRTEEELYQAKKGDGTRIP